MNTDQAFEILTARVRVLCPYSILEEFNLWFEWQVEASGVHIKRFFHFEVCDAV